MNNNVLNNSAAAGSLKTEARNKRIVLTALLMSVIISVTAIFSAMKVVSDYTCLVSEMETRIEEISRQNMELERMLDQTIELAYAKNG